MDEVLLHRGVPTWLCWTSRRTLPTARSHRPRSSIHGLKSASLPPELKVRARCGNTARRDLCGGHGATRVPTATRSVASTILNENGFPPDVIERQLAHCERNQVRSAYNHAEYLKELHAMM